MFGEIADPPDETAMAPIVVNSLAARLRMRCVPTTHFETIRTLPSNTAT